MWRWIQELDRILRGEATRLSALQGGTIKIPAGGISLLLVILGLSYGFCMGCYALLRPTGPSYAQWFASTVKVPALFALTCLVTFPSLYVFNALVGSRLRVGAMLQLLITGLAVTLSVLASFGPIVCFFSVSTTSYPFMVLLNVLMFAIAGVLGLTFLLRTLHRLSLVDVAAPVAATAANSTTSAPQQNEPEPRGALDRLDGHFLSAHVKTVFRCWIVVFGVVGAQMSWVLRPFIGNPDVPFAWFRPRQSNFFEAVAEALLQLFT